MHDEKFEVTSEGVFRFSGAGSYRDQRDHVRRYTVDLQVVSSCTTFCRGADKNAAIYAAPYLSCCCPCKHQKYQSLPALSCSSTLWLAWTQARILTITCTGTRRIAAERSECIRRFLRRPLRELAPAPQRKDLQISPRRTHMGDVRARG